MKEREDYFEHCRGPCDNTIALKVSAADVNQDGCRCASFEHLSGMMMP